MSRGVWTVVAAGIVARLVLLVVRGDYLVYDEGYYLLIARSLGSGEGYALNGLRHVALSPLLPVVVAALSLLGMPDLWASRLLGAAAGALLPVPVAFLGTRLAGPRAGLLAAALTAASPALMSYTPFFPGTTWNLYFGTEPLFLLLLFGATACAARAADGGSRRWWLGTGALCGAAFLARAEGLIAAPLVMAALATRLLAVRADATAWRRWAVAAVLGFAIATPYLGYLRVTLGRWALSGRVQARGAAATVVPSPTQRGGAVLDEMVWGGNVEGFREQLYRLDATGLAMRSQYWGVARGEEAAVGGDPGAAAPRPRADPAVGPPDSATLAPTRPPQARVRPPLAATLARGLSVTLPWWLALLGVAGLAASWRRAMWLAPALAAALLPALLVYVEPRSLLPVVPVAAIGAAVLLARAADRLEAAGGRGRVVGLLLALGAVGALGAPAVRDAWRARAGDTALQQVASAQRAVGRYLDEHLPPDAVVMSWHPAVAIWAGRPWRVLPYEPLDRIVRYAGSQRVAAVVFSRFHPSPLDQPPRSFTVMVLDGDTAAVGASVTLERVDETPLLFVGRLRRERR